MKAIAFVLIALAVVVSGCVAGESVVSELKKQKTAAAEETPKETIMPLATEEPKSNKLETNTGDPEQRSCLLSGGEWVLFGDTCMDTCIKARQHVEWCENRDVYGCECGTDRCWNGSACEPNQV